MVRLLFAGLLMTLAIPSVAPAAKVVYRLRCTDGTFIEQPRASCEVDAARDGRCDFVLHTFRGGTPVDVLWRVRVGERKTYRYLERFQFYRYVMRCRRHT